MSTHTIESYTDASGESRWRIKVGGEVIAVSSEGYTDKRNALGALFGLFFGEYDDSFLALYGEWQTYANVERTPEPSAKLTSVDSATSTGTGENGGSGSVPAPSGVPPVANTTVNFSSGSG
jgi:uncharacterized protein YegP (UPF0339 family)